MRWKFGGAATDRVVDDAGNAVTGRNVIFWSAQTGGSQVTDLLSQDGTAAAFVTTDLRGYLPSFDGPNDGRLDLWADAQDGGPRRRIVSLGALLQGFGLATGAIATSQRGVAGGVAALDSAGDVLTASGARAQTTETAADVRLEAKGAAPARSGTTVGVGAARRVFAGGVDSVRTSAAFPGLAMTADGRLVAVLKDGADEGTVGSVRWSVSSDLGATWAPTQLVFEPPTGMGAGPGGVTVLRDGRWVVCLQKVDAQGTAGAFVTFSSNDGTTWTVPTSIGGGFGAKTATSAPIVELANGHLVCAIYGWDATGTDYSVLVASTNGGATWSRRSVIHQHATVDVWEPMVIETAPGQLVCLTRGADYIVRRHVSLDAGVSWLAPSNLWTDNDARVDWIKLASGRCVAMYRQSPAANGLGLVRTSDNNFASYTSAEPVVGPDGRVTYAALVEVTPGRLACLYGAEMVNKAFGDVWLRYLTDGAGLTPLGDTTHVTTRERAGQSPLLAWDGFGRPDNAQGIGSADSGHKWQGNVLKALGGVARPKITTGQAVAWVETGVADVDVEGDFFSGTATASGLVVRRIANGDFLFINPEGAAKMRLIKSVGGVLTVLAAYDPAPVLAPIGAWQTYRVILRGAQVRVFLDSERVITHTLVAADQTAFGGGGGHGLRLNEAFGGPQSCRRFTVRA